MTRTLDDLGEWVPGQESLPGLEVGQGDLFGQPIEDEPMADGILVSTLATELGWTVGAVLAEADAEIGRRHAAGGLESIREYSTYITAGRGWVTPLLADALRERKRTEQ